MLSMMFNLRNIEHCVALLSKASLNYVLFRNREWWKSCRGKELEGKLNLAGSFKVKEIPGHAGHANHTF